MRLNLQDIINI